MRASIDRFLPRKRDSLLMNHNVLLDAKCIDAPLRRQLNGVRQIIEFNGFESLDSFTYYLTLYSECFSTFPHGTCSLSVSWSYLALDGTYHLLWAALSSNPTLTRIQSTNVNPSRAFHPLWGPNQGILRTTRRNVE